MFPAVIKPYTFNDTANGRPQSIFIDPSQSEAAARYFKIKGRVEWWDHLSMPPETECHEHKRIKWMSKADIRKADCHPSKLKVRTWAEARRTPDRRMKKLWKMFRHHDACVVQIERESYEHGYRFTGDMRKKREISSGRWRNLSSSGLKRIHKGVFGELTKSTKFLLHYFFHLLRRLESRNKPIHML